MSKVFFKNDESSLSFYYRCRDYNPSVTAHLIEENGISGVCFYACTLKDYYGKNYIQSETEQALLDIAKNEFAQSIFQV